MKPFDPLEFDFVLLRDFKIPGGVAVYELGNHPAVDGTHDYLRLNFYMSKDGQMEFTTGKLATVERPDDFEFLESYNQDLFRGHIESTETAVHIMKALRIGVADRPRAFPQILRAGEDNKLRCDMM